MRKEASLGSDVGSRSEITKKLQGVSRKQSRRTAAYVLDVLFALVKF